MGWEKEKKNYVLSCKLGMIMNMLPKNIIENPEPCTEPPYCNNWIVYFARHTSKTLSSQSKELPDTL